MAESCNDGLAPGLGLASHIARRNRSTLCLPQTAPRKAATLLRTRRHMAGADRES